MERRANRRFRMKLPMRARWTNLLGDWEAQAECEDIASRGVYFFLPAEIENGSSVELVIVMPHEITLAEPVRVRCRGRVRRTKIEAMDRVGVVVEIQRYQFLGEKEEKLAPRFRITSDMRESLTSSIGRRIGQ
ncbi:MAG: hypothetical protein DMG30_24500 [Acidobacteria bacterium]|nr:MAG: hypothetical protein DMG30_24500 [Acidobacteriota bacterium]